MTVNDDAAELDGDGVQELVSSESSAGLGPHADPPALKHGVRAAL